MKKLCILLLSLVCVFSVVTACNPVDSSVQTSESSSQQQESSTPEVQTYLLSFNGGDATGEMDSSKYEAGVEIT